MQYHKITVVIPVHNRVETLVEALKAIYKSTYPHFEVIVFDDASTDNIREAVKDFNCIYLRSEKQSGPSVGRNAGAKQATGDIILYIDGDVLVPPDALHKVNEQITENKYDGVVGTFTSDIRFKNYASNYKNLFVKYVFSKMPPVNGLIYTSLMGVKKAALEEIGGFDENDHIYPCEDHELGLRLTRKYRIFLQRDLEIEHVRHYDIISLLKKDFVVSLRIIRTHLRFRKIKARDKKNLPTLRSFNASVGLSGLLLLFAVLSAVGPFFALAAAALALAILLLNGPFLFFLLKKKGFLFFLETCFFIYLEFFFYGFGTLTGIIGYWCGRKY
jgi:glycosyltransferase involved in cell wall biosynthesis